MELSKFDMRYDSKTIMKSQVLVDFMAELRIDNLVKQ